MSVISRLFGRGAKAEQPSEIYKEFRIVADPERAEGGYRLGARIEKDIGGETRVHHLLRADTCQSLDEAEAFSIRKARQMIDEQGDRIFRH